MEDFGPIFNPKTVMKQILTKIHIDLNIVLFQDQLEATTPVLEPVASTSDFPSTPNSSKNQKSAQNTAKQSSYISAPPPFSPIKRDKKPVDPEEIPSSVGNATEESFVVGQDNPSTSTKDSGTTEESVPCPVCQVTFSALKQKTTFSCTFVSVSSFFNSHQ